MNADADVQERWNQARHDLLNLLLEFHNQWNLAFTISHNCGHLKTPYPGKCKASLEKAWERIDDLDHLFEKYRSTIQEMRDLVQAMSRLPEAPPPRQP